MNLAAVWGPLGFSAAAHGVGGGMSQTILFTGHSGRQSAHNSIIIFLRRGFRTTRTDERLDVRGEAQEKLGDGEDTPNCGTGREGERSPLQDSSARSFTDSSLIQVLGTHKLCFKYEKNLII